MCFSQRSSGGASRLATTLTQHGITYLYYYDDFYLTDTLNECNNRVDNSSARTAKLASAAHGLKRNSLFKWWIACQRDISKSDSDEKKSRNTSRRMDCEKDALNIRYYERETRRQIVSTFFRRSPSRHFSVFIFRDSSARSYKLQTTPALYSCVLLCIALRQTIANAQRVGEIERRTSVWRRC